MDAPQPDGATVVDWATRIVSVVIAVAKESKGPETDHFDEARLAERIMIAALAPSLLPGPPPIPSIRSSAGSASSRTPSEWPAATHQTARPPRRHS
jgi:hypothetical protein